MTVADDVDRRILLCTVGGSHAPVLTAIRAARPEHVVFFCTDRDPGTNQPGSRVLVEGKGLCIRESPDAEKPTLSNIPSQCVLEPSRYEVRIVPADDLDGACEVIAQTLREVAARFPGGRLLADYSGGTKTMSAALVLEALETEGVLLQFVAGNRADLVKVRDGTEMPAPARVDAVRLRRAMAPFLAAWTRFAYDEAAAGLSTLPAPADPRLRAPLLRARDLSSAFAAWDRFDHAAALRLFELYAPQIAPRMPGHFGALRILTDAEAPRATGLRIWDLWLNAQRRARTGRYDDAVARLYRAMEWTAQWVLARCAGIDTADVPAQIALAAGPPLQPDREGKYSAGLYAAWTLVGARTSGPARAFFESHRDALRGHLKARNASILAHGFAPVTREAWTEMSAWFESALVPVLIAELALAGLREPFSQLPDRHEPFD